MQTFFFGFFGFIGIRYRYNFTSWVHLFQLSFSFWLSFWFTGCFFLKGVVLDWYIIVKVFGSFMEGISGSVSFSFILIIAWRRHTRGHIHITHL